MKALKLTLVLLVSIGLVFSLSFCGDDETTPVTPDPTPPSGVCIDAGATDNTGAFCSIADKLYGYCLFEDEGEAILTTEEVGQIVLQLNTFWDTLVAQMSGTSFDAQAVKDSFADVVDFISSDTGVNLVPMLIDLLGEINLCDDGEGNPVLTQETLDEIVPMVESLAYATDGELWGTINEYASLLGLTAEQAQTIINGALQTLNEDMALITHDGSVGAAVDGILDAWDEAACATNAFDSASLTATAYNPNLIALLEAIDGDADPASPDFTAIISSLLDTEVSYLIGTVVDLLGSIHSTSTDISLIAGLLPTLPGLISGLITSDMDQCE